MSHCVGTQLHKVDQTATLVIVFLKELHHVPTYLSMATPFRCVAAWQHWSASACFPSSSNSLQSDMLSAALSECSLRLGQEESSAFAPTSG
eukprot:m.301303 g.301303  ORF g.301303 m.301303 type:complete len:91 (+) comp20138_c0_seq5:19-291(+)